MEFLRTMAELAWGAGRFQGDAFRTVSQAEGGLELALAVAFLAGFSEMVGQCVVLFLNRVPRRRFVLCLVASGFFLVAGVLFWTGSIWLAATFVFGVQRPFHQLLAAVCLAHAPLLLGFLVLLPYLGLILHHLFRIWILVTTLVAVGVTNGFSFWPAIACCALGWLFHSWLSHLGLFRLERLQGRLWARLAGPEPPEVS